MKRENPFDEIPEDRTAVDNILRINVTNQMRLTVMADQKANIMITVASIVFSVTVANLDNEVMKWPLLFFAFGCTISLLAAIFAIIPQTGYPKIPGTDEIDRESPAFNPLFFGHFAHIPIEEYKEDYAETLMTDDRIYDALAGDIYGIGTTLMNNKYKWLRRSYMAFLVGMSGAITIFCVQTIGSADWIWDMMGAVGQELKFIGEGLCFYSLRC
tara:strand:- start:54 stop:695 length:642 start_codon:yes stop_codon:yes gene_type:complete